jgi:predicted transport protein
MNKLDRLDVMDHLELLQEKVEDMGYMGTGEFELELREQTADYIMSIVERLTA